MSHTLIIEEGESWEIEHPDECWVEVRDWDGGPALYRDTDCKISGKINWDPDVTDGFDNLPPGRYTITYRHEGKGECYTDWILVGCDPGPVHGPHDLCPGSGYDRAVRS